MTNVFGVVLIGTTKNLRHFRDGGFSGRIRCIPGQVYPFDNQLHPLVAPQVSHFSQVPLRTIVKFWHSEQLLPV